VKIKFNANYPLDVNAIYAEMLTPLFHPHVWRSGVICKGRQWMVSEFLDLLATRIGSIICFDPDYFDFNSPAHGEAMEWAKNHMRLFPTDTMDIGQPKATVQWNEVKHVKWKSQ
jgi:ubiquitin-protein ligase